MATQTVVSTATWHPPDWKLIEGIRQAVEEFLVEFTKNPLLRVLRKEPFQVHKRIKLAVRSDDIERWSVCLLFPGLGRTWVGLRVTRFTKPTVFWQVTGYGYVRTSSHAGFPERVRSRREYFEAYKRPVRHQGIPQRQQKRYDIRWIGVRSEPPYRRDQEGVWPLA